MEKLIFSEAALERYVRNRQTLTVPIKITAGVPSVIGSEQPKILIEKGLAGSQVILSQANIDDLLGVDDDVDAAAAFGATAMVANDTLGLVLASDGQLSGLDIAQAYTTGATAIDISEEASSLPNSAFSNLEVLVSPAGNLVCRFEATNITAAATTTLLYINFYLRLK